MTEAGAGTERTLADRLDKLFETIRRPDGRKHSNAEVAAFCRAHTGESCSREYISQLRKGKRDNPTKRNLEALAAFFDLSPAYFFDDTQSERIRGQLELAAALRDSDVRQIALRAVRLGKPDLRLVTDMIESLARRQAEREGEDGHPGR